MRHTYPKCDCGDIVCIQNGGYVYVDSGISICAAGCVQDGMPIHEMNPAESHMIVEAPANTLITNTKGDLRPGAQQRREATAQGDPSANVAAVIAAARSNAPAQSTNNAKDPLALRGRVNADKRTISELCTIMQLPDRVLTEAYMILDYINTQGGKEFKRRATKRQALMIAIVCIACERNGTDYHGERLRQMCTSVLGRNADAKTFTQFGRVLRSLRISLSRALGNMGVVSENYTMRIVNHAWGRLGRSGLSEIDIAQVTHSVVNLVKAWPEADTKFGDAVIPCVIYMKFGDDNRTVAACDEYNYRVNTIVRHVNIIQQHVGSDFLVGCKAAAVIVKNTPPQWSMA